MSKNLKIRADFDKVFKSTEGKRVLAALYEECGMSTQIFVPGDESATLHNSGKHRIGQYLQGMLSQEAAEVVELVHKSRKDQMMERATQFGDLTTEGRTI